MDNELNEFNNINDQVDDTIQKIEEEQAADNDQTPLKRNCKPVQDYEPSFENKRYKTCAQVVKNDTESIDEITFVQVLAIVFQQMSLKAGIKKHGEKAVEGFTKELQQMHLRKIFQRRKMT